MRVADFHYDLPPEAIAQHPLPERGASRLLVIDGCRDRREDRAFRDLPALLSAGDLLVFNDTRVLPARLTGHKAGTGGRVEVLVETMGADGRTAHCHVRASKSPGPGTVLELAAGAMRATVRGRDDELYILDFEPDDDAGLSLAERLERHGLMPLPPYIDRVPDASDRERYQTVYARARGAVAAPTAGLHFDREMLDRLARAGVASAHLTLHVGGGTFRPVRSECVEDHRMHAERIDVPPATCEAIAATRARGGRVIAVGTTVVRSLETAVDDDGVVAPFRGETRLFITPGSRFRVVDGLITNFHLPGSTLLMLVCALGGHERILAAYRHAVAAGYRFFSYGDACLVWPETGVRVA